MGKYECYSSQTSFRSPTRAVVQRASSTGEGDAAARPAPCMQMEQYRLNLGTRQSTVMRCESSEAIQIVGVNLNKGMSFALCKTACLTLEDAHDIDHCSLPTHYTHAHVTHVVDRNRYSRAEPHPKESLSAPSAFLKR